MKQQIDTQFKKTFLKKDYFRFQNGVLYLGKTDVGIQL